MRIQIDSYASALDALRSELALTGVDPKVVFIEASDQVLVVPSASPDAEGTLRFEDLLPPAEVLAAVSDYLDAVEATARTLTDDDGHDARRRDFS